MAEQLTWQVTDLYDLAQREQGADHVVLDLRYETDRGKEADYLTAGYCIREKIPGYLVWLSDHGV